MHTTNTQKTLYSCVCVCSSMANVINQRQTDRHNKTLSIKTMIMKTLEEGRKVDYERLVMVVRTDLGLADRTAKEYIENALFGLNKTKEETCMNSN